MLVITNQETNRRHLLPDPWPSSYDKWAPHPSSPPEGQWCWPGWFQSPQSPPSATETSPRSRPGELLTPPGSWGMLSDTAKSKTAAQWGGDGGGSGWESKRCVYNSIRSVIPNRTNTSYYAEYFPWRRNISLSLCINFIYRNLQSAFSYFLCWISWSCLFSLQKMPEIDWVTWLAL